jgi:translation initiation factor 2B subunit (eIF-2B alpha/beta/delta family)
LTVIKAKKYLPHFASVKNYISFVEKLLKRGNDNKLEVFIRLFNEVHLSKYQQLYENAKPFLKDVNSVLTISNSGTIFEILKLLAIDQKNLRVFISESRPRNEGRLLAKALLKENISVELITDAAISTCIGKVDAVILGADAVLKTGDVINKTGSMAAALLCKYYKKPVYIITTNEKFLSKKSFKQDRQNEDEVWNFKNKNLKISNYYFEEIPKDLITKIITD